MPAVGNVITGNGTVPTGGSSGQVLSKNSNTNYDLAWISAPPASAGGSNTQIQYSNAGSLGGVPTLTYDGTNTVIDLSAADSTKVRIKANQTTATKDAFIQSRGAINYSVGANTYWNGTNWIYDTTAPAALMYINSGAGAGSSFVVQTAPSGTAGTTATMTTGLQAFNSTGVSVGGVSDPGAGNLKVAGTITVGSAGTSTQWDTAFTNNLRWDGGSTSLVAATGRTSLGATTIGNSFFTAATGGVASYARITAGGGMIQDPYATVLSNIQAPVTKVIWYTTGTGTYTVSAGVRAIYVECVGGGGGGGGSSTCSAQGSAAGGGGGGAYSATYQTSPAASYTYTVGGGGAGGVANGNAGSGSPSSLGTICVASGGAGTVTQTAAATVQMLAGGAGGVATTGTGDVKCYGGMGGTLMRWSGTQVWSGYGGSSIFGNGGWSVLGNAGGNAGVNALVPGAGGSGGATIGTASVGGNGAAGSIKITEYF